jgi:hypothetical protein
MGRREKNSLQTFVFLLPLASAWKMTICMNDSETKVWLDSRPWFMALCVDSLTLVEPCFLCALQDRNNTLHGHHLLISQSPDSSSISGAYVKPCLAHAVTDEPSRYFSIQIMRQTFLYVCNILAFKIWLCLHRLEFSICSTSPTMNLQRHLFRKTPRISTRIKERKKKNHYVPKTISMIF